MTENTPLPQYIVGPDEKIAPVMAYTETGIVWGDVIVKNAIRVSTWLRTSIIPDHLYLLNARSMLINGGNLTKPTVFKELHLPTSQIIAYHLVPPARDPLDFDASEPNRKMEPVTLMVGPYRLDGNLRMAVKSDLAKYIEVAHELFTSLYEVEISYPGSSALGVVHIPFVLVRMAQTIFAC